MAGRGVSPTGSTPSAQRTRTGDCRCPSSSFDARSGYLSGVIDVADISALLIAGAHDPGGILDGGDPGVNDTQQDLIDKANDLSG